jgi:predicted negative regulator of RcsB-dependent stress response
MTSTQPTQSPQGETSIIEWLQVNSRILGIAASVIAVAGLGYWFYLRAAQIKNTNAERVLLSAQQSLVSGNKDLAKSDLQNVVNRYDKTPAGTEAALMLAQISYEDGKFQDGVNLLQRQAEGRAARGTLPTVLGLLGDGYSQLGKAADAAKNYERAADATTFENEKAYYRAKAARTYSSAGDVSSARRVWTELAKNDKSGAIAAEAKVRLAELDAKPAGKS